MEKSFKAALKKKGAKGAVRYVFGKLVGMDDYEDRLNTLEYFLNAYCDITKCPPAEENLRNVQMGDTLLLEVFDLVCRKNNLEYWLDCGSLLGAARHKGFIPWDDDVDLCMTRDTYNRALKILPEQFKALGIDAEEKPDEPNARIGVGYKHRNTGIWIDVFPVEATKVDVSDASKQAVLHAQCLKFKKKYLKNRTKIGQEASLKQKLSIIDGICDDASAASYIFTLENTFRVRSWTKDVIFPLSTITFENISLPAPNNTDAYLKVHYGANYMGFPQTGVAHHGDDRGPLSIWAKNTGTDMNVIFDELRAIRDSLKKELNESK